MAAKPTAAAAPAVAGDGKSQASTQIMQHLAALSTEVKELKQDLKEIKTLLGTLGEGSKTMGVAMASMENRLASLGDQVKAAAGAKRTPKAPGSGTAGGESNSSVPTGEKMPSTSFAWFGQEYKKNPEAVRNKYFTPEQIQKVNTKLNGTEAYTKIDPTKGTPEQQAKAKLDRSIMEAKELVAELKSDKEKIAKLKKDWDAAKSEWEAKNRTPAKKEGDAPAAAEDDAS
jgi:regulator of replication initiation timing